MAKWLGAGLLTSFRVGRLIRILDIEPGAVPPPDVPLQQPYPAPLPSNALTPPPPPLVLAAVPFPVPSPLPAAELRQIPDMPRRARPSLRKPVYIGSVPVPVCAGVYVVRQGIAAKIGHAKNLQRRLTDLQIAHPSPLIVVGYIETPTVRDAQQLEHRLHRQFADERIRGEWFRLTGPVVEALQAEGHWHAPALLVNARKG